MPTWLIRSGFDAIIIATALYAILRGNREHRYVAMLFVAATILSIIAVPLSALRWRSPNTPLFLVDLSLLAMLLWLTLRTRRYWPSWVTAFQLVSVLTHVGRLLAPRAVPYVYLVAEQFWAYPMIVVLVAAIRAHHLDEREISTGLSGPKGHLGSAAWQSPSSP